MPSFRLNASERNIAIANYLEDVGKAVKTFLLDGCVRVEFEWDITVARFMLESAIGVLTDREWQALIREIKRSLRRANVRNASDQFFTIQVARQCCIGARVSLAEKGIICKAAELKHETPSVFIREAALEKAEGILEGWKQEKQTEGGRT